jgi:hypothetical protein
MRATLIGKVVDGGAALGGHPKALRFIPCRADVARARGRDSEASEGIAGVMENPLVQQAFCEDAAGQQRTGQQHGGAGKFDEMRG